MKIWFGMQGDNTVAWQEWVTAVKKWGRAEQIHSYSSGIANMAEAHIRYDEAFRPSTQINLLHPVILDGWISGGLNAKSDGTRKIEQYDKLYASLKQDQAAMLSHSHGEYTMVWWDDSLHSLVLATDTYATRPVYYWVSPKGEWFAANDLRILLLVHDIPFAIDQDVCRMFPTSGFAVGENGFEDRTFFKGIRKVPAASYAFLGRDHAVHVHSYWGLPQLLNVKDLAGDAVPRFRELFQKVTADRLKDQRHIVELSGGLDSAAVTAAAVAGGCKEQLLAVNISFAEPDMILSHDKDLVKNMMRDMDIPGLIILGDATAKIPNAEIGRDPLWFIDGPDPRANSLVNETFTVIAEEYGASSVLTGEGGDFIFSGEVSVLDSLLRKRRFSEIYKLLREWSGGSMKEMLKLGFQYGIAPFIPYIGEKLYYDLLWSDTEYELPEYFTEEHRKREREINKEDHLRYRKSRELSVWGKRFHFDFLWPRARYMDAVGVTLPTYHPFLDRRLIEFSFSVPPEQHFDVLKGLEEHYAGSKMLLRKSFTDILPAYVYNRSTKTTYAHMARKSFMNDRRHVLQLFEPGERVFVEELGIIKRDIWWKHLLAMAIRSEDPNNDLGMGYQYMRSVIDLEIWLREASKGKEHLLDRSRPGKPRVMADIETVNTPEKAKIYSYQ